MSLRLRDALTGGIPELRYEPTAKRVRASHAGETVVDTTAAVLLWEPRRVVPTYAVPATAIRLPVRAAEEARPVGADVGLPLPDVSTRPVLDPSIPFAAHTAAGRAADVGPLAGAGFVLDDPALDGYVCLDFAAFDSWLEEDRPTIGHPRDPFHRIDVLPSSRHVRVERDGELLAESTAPVLLFETMLPPRFYLPRGAVVADLVPSATRTTCAYKGHAAYWTVGDTPDLAWTYPEPLAEAAGVRDLVCFFDERVDVVLDGERRPRPVTPWS